MRGGGREGGGGGGGRRQLGWTNAKKNCGAKLAHNIVSLDHCHHRERDSKDIDDGPCVLPWCVTSIGTTHAGVCGNAEVFCLYLAIRSDSVCYPMGVSPLLRMPGITLGAADFCGGRFKCKRGEQ